MKAKTLSDVEKMNEAPKLFVRFKSDTCPHCVISQPDWDEFMKRLKKHKLVPGCVVGEIESALADSFKGTSYDGSPFQVQGVPAYELFRNGKQLRRKPPGRDPDSLMNVLKKEGFLRKTIRSRRQKGMTLRNKRRPLTM
jgi:thiol-disulfide isomerase/thioredoxin